MKISVKLKKPFMHVQNGHVKATASHRNIYDLCTPYIM